MTVATFKLVGDVWHIDISGHAGYNKDGPDIVCSACSVLTCTLVQCLRDLEHKGAVKDIVLVDHRGDVKLSFGVVKPEAHAVVHTIMEGFALLDNAYPHYVRHAYKAEKSVGADSATD